MPCTGYMACWWQSLAALISKMYGVCHISTFLPIKGKRVILGVDLDSFAQVFHSEDGPLASYRQTHMDFVSPTEVQDLYIESEVD